MSGISDKKFHCRHRGTNAGKYRCAHIEKQVNLLLIYNFYLCFAYLNWPSIQHLSGSKNPTTLLKTGQSVSQTRNALFAHFLGQVTPFQGATFSQSYQAGSIQLHFRRNAHSSGGWQIYQCDDIIYTFSADPPHSSCLSRNTTSARRDLQR